MMKAGNRAVTEETQRQIARLQALGWYHSIQLPNGEVIAGHQTLAQQQARLRQFPIPEDLGGKRVLDIGAWDGWFSFEMEKRGAEVVAVDAVRNEKLLLARDLLGSRIDYRVASVYDLHPAELGRFDIVLFLGVLYHLKHPLLALERVCALSTGMACVESFVTDDPANPTPKPSLEFYETTELCGQFDNWVGPNVACLLAFCRTAGFVRVELESVIDNRAHVTCRRHWDSAGGSGAAPYIVSAETAADDYVSVWFKSPYAGLTVDEVFPEIGGFAIRPALLHDTGGDGWHAIVKRPPGIGAGPAEVRVRARDSAFSNVVRIGADVSEKEHSTESPAGELTIEIVADGQTWERNQVRLTANASLSLWVRGLPGDCRREDVVVRVAGRDLPSVFVSAVDPQGLRQVNAILPTGLAPAQENVSVVVGGAASQSAPLAILTE